jgi:ABC-type Co2+ transport system permease subunit
MVIPVRKRISRESAKPSPVIPKPQGVHQTSTQILAGLSLLAAVNMGVAAIEAFLTGFMVAYIGKVKPEILEGDGK